MSSVGSGGSTAMDGAPSISDGELPLAGGSRRSEGRNVVSYFGIIENGDGNVMQVNLVDLSANGARMVLPKDYEPPKQIILRVPETGASFLAEVVWQQERTCGLKFMNPNND
ncbi:MAG: PilZ domain-containing protein [Pseudomonadota bacterium]